MLQPGTSSAVYEALQLFSPTQAKLCSRNVCTALNLCSRISEKSYS